MVDVPCHMPGGRVTQHSGGGRARPIVERVPVPCPGIDRLRLNFCPVCQRSHPQSIDLKWYSNKCWSRQLLQVLFIGLVLLLLDWAKILAMLLSNNKSTNDYNHSTLQQAVLCAMVATTYLATYLVWGYYVQCTSDLSTQLNWGKTK